MAGTTTVLYRSRRFAGEIPSMVLPRTLRPQTMAWPFLACRRPRAKSSEVFGLRSKQVNKEGTHLVNAPSVV